MAYAAAEWNGDMYRSYTSYIIYCVHGYGSIIELLNENHVFLPFERNHIWQSIVHCVHNTRIPRSAYFD